MTGTLGEVYKRVGGDTCPHVQSHDGSPVNARETGKSGRLNEVQEEGERNTRWQSDRSRQSKNNRYGKTDERTRETTWTKRPLREQVGDRPDIPGLTSGADRSL